MSTTTVRSRRTLEEFVDCGSYNSLDHLGVICHDVRITTRVVEVEVDSDGALKLLPTSPEIVGTWCEYACAARDRLEQNMEVFLDDSSGSSVGGRSRAAVRTTRRVVPGDELFVWFEDSLARQRNIPILTPANIRGKDEYLCTFCGATFQRPNPLKSHIRFHCNSLHTSVPPVSSSTSFTSAYFPTPLLFPPVTWFSSCFPASPRVLMSSQYDVAGNTLGGARNVAGSRWLDYLREISLARAPDDSAAKIRDVTTSDVTDQSAGVERSKTTSSTSQLVPVRSKLRSGGDGCKYECPYCGKLYSRRYGLKIHIRTHTGFKPLQCSVCRRPFGDPSNLNKHVRLHGDQTSSDIGRSTAYRCRHCGKVLVRRRDLDRHLRARHSHQLSPSPVNVTTSGARDNTVLVTSSECVSADDD